MVTFTRSSVPPDRKSVVLNFSISAGPNKPSYSTVPSPFTGVAERLVIFVPSNNSDLSYAILINENRIYPNNALASRAISGPDEQFLDILVNEGDTIALYASNASLTNTYNISATLEVRRRENLQPPAPIELTREVGLVVQGPPAHPEPEPVVVVEEPVQHVKPIEDVAKQPEPLQEVQDTLKAATDKFVLFTKDVSPDTVWAGVLLGAAAVGGAVFYKFFKERS